MTTTAIVVAKLVRLVEIFDGGGPFNLGLYREGNNKLTNVDIKLADITTHEMEDRYDRIVAIGLFEHVEYISSCLSSGKQKAVCPSQSSEINKLTNVDIKLADIATHEMEDRYDRIIAIGLIEHMKNYELLLRKLSKWMTPDGLLFIDYLCHKTFAYNFEVNKY
ncbi:hypothetical protein Syun_030781 [Stephania yunnanensis]|uniref:Uncharacterized protein n=1 Tax=Stephania yunnanensis TaxID=152371 RepID=A0AAP0DYF6_9MAGN